MAEREGWGKRARLGQARTGGRMSRGRREGRAATGDRARSEVLERARWVAAGSRRWPLVEGPRGVQRGWCPMDREGAGNVLPWIRLSSSSRLGARPIRLPERRAQNTRPNLRRAQLYLRPYHTSHRLIDYTSARNNAKAILKNQNRAASGLFRISIFFAVMGLL